jgi:hypothetical protein
MKKFLFAVAVALLSAIPASADEPKPVPATPGSTPAPAVTATTGSTMVYSSSTSTRRGLFARLRARFNRGSMMTTTEPYTGTMTPMPSTGTVVPTHDGHSRRGCHR